MTDLIKQAPVVKIATISKNDLKQIGFCAGLRQDDDGTFYQKKAGESPRALVVVGWVQRGYGRRFILVRRVDDGRLLQQGLTRRQKEFVAANYPQLFIR